MNIFHDHPLPSGQVQHIANLALRVSADMDDLCVLLRELPEAIVPITETDDTLEPFTPDNKNPVAAALLPLIGSFRSVRDAYTGWQGVRKALLEADQEVDRARKQRTEGPTRLFG